MHARSALFDIYGDHLRDHSNTAPVAALVQLLEPIGITAPAVRTAVSRMVAHGWLEPVRVHGQAGYRATPRAVQRLDDAGDRIYRRTDRSWDGHWHLAVVSGPAQRSARNRLHADLEWLGYAQLADAVWVGPHARQELPSVVTGAGATLVQVVAETLDPPGAPLQAWDLDVLAGAYEDFLVFASELVETHGTAGDDADRDDFAVRFRLVHEWRKFLFRDPGLPDHLLPSRWPGREAASYFSQQAAQLQPGARRFVLRCLDGAADYDA